MPVMNLTNIDKWISTHGKPMMGVDNSLACLVFENM
jgi:hypothetical protein